MKMPLDSSYYVIRPEKKSNDAVEAFVTWLLKEASESTPIA
jgi:hypothetical protein